MNTPATPSAPSGVSPASPAASASPASPAASDPAHLVLSLSCPDRPGIVHAVSGVLARRGGNITESKQFGDEDSGLFFMRVQVMTTVPREELEKDLAELAETYTMTWSLDEVGRPLRTLIMVSKEGHCLTDLLFRARSQGLPIDVVGVVGNHEDLRPVAEFYGAPFTCIPVTRETKEAAEAELLRLVGELDVELVVLARYMQILSPALCERLHGGVINIHHSFLPSFKGANPYRQAHQRGVKLIGATAHYVTADLDEGPIIEQDVTRAAHEDTVATLRAKGQDVERRVLAQAVRWHAEHRVLLNGQRTVVFA
ncbi:formyltetrahydrofolate deformylase [Actinomyces massiliensis]|mgnify:FL=1|uniref:Formyltetrahydrofolate deformylase n=1 Tax=Actinomyces massiliensis F0489 TaxID=1125718 RepID=J1HPK1_9ACTO|nr:formyltetrahydrofolate deformylase [Actinomyces massiliensis]EJF47528.1 formyltetrahydrofolate deformylase [Actinomyces massiliensis F0489]WLD72489.1 formyltetrahydrofolate deformylase [Actinomyces massiliensis]